MFRAVGSALPVRRHSLFSRGRSVGRILRGFQLNPQMGSNGEHPLAEWFKIFTGRSYLFPGPLLFFDHTQNWVLIAF